MDRREQNLGEEPVKPGAGGNMNRKTAGIARILAVALMLVAGLLLAAALPAQGQTLDAHRAHPALISAGSVQPQPRAKPVARVNGAVLTDVDLLREMYAIFPYARQHNGSFPKAMAADIRRGALNMIEFEELVYQEAVRRHMTIAPERLAKAEREFQQQFSTEQEYREFLKSETNGSLSAMRARIARSLLIEDLLKIEVKDKSHVSLAEARTYYREHPAQFRLPESYALQTITIMPPVRPSRTQPNPPPPTPAQLKEMRTRAEAALRQAQATKTYEQFGSLAEKISEDDYRVMMGDHKPVAAKDLPLEILAAVSKMQPGQISGVIHAEDAYAIVRLNAHTPERMQSFSEMSSQLRGQLQGKKQETLRHQLNAKLRKTARIEEL